MREKRGFIAILSVVLLASVAMLIVFGRANTVATLFDEARLKSERGEAMQSGLLCLRQAITELTHDYFYDVGHVDTPAILYPVWHCRISVVASSVGTFNASNIVTSNIRNNPGTDRIINVEGYSRSMRPGFITAHIRAQIHIQKPSDQVVGPAQNQALLFDNIQLISATTTF